MVLVRVRGTRARADIAAGQAYARGLRRLPRGAGNENMSPLAEPDLPVGRRHAGHDRDGAHGLAAKLAPHHAQYHPQARRSAQRVAYIAAWRRRARRVMPLRTIVAALLLLTCRRASMPTSSAAGQIRHDRRRLRRAKPEFEIRRGIVEGPDLLCILGAPNEAAGRYEAYEAKCTQGEKVHLGVLTIDRSDPTISRSACRKRGLDCALPLQMMAFQGELPSTALHP